jgi:hypothetical protein
MFIYSYDCVCESLSMLLDMRSRSENRYGSGVFVLSTSFIYFYFVTGLRAMMGKISATGSERGNGFDLSLFMISERICHSMESRTFHIYIGIQQKIPGKESINHFAQLVPWHPHDLPRTTYYLFLSSTHFFPIFSGRQRIPSQGQIPDRGVHGFPFASRCSCQRCPCFCASPLAWTMLLGLGACFSCRLSWTSCCLFPGCHAVLILPLVVFLSLATLAVLSMHYDLTFNFALVSLGMM